MRSDDDTSTDKTSSTPRSRRTAIQRPRPDRNHEPSEAFDGYGEPSLDDLLADPVCRAVMRRDNVEDHHLRALIDQAGPEDEDPRDES